MPMPYQKIWRTHIWSYHGSMATSGLASVALQTNSAPITIRQASASNWSRSSFCPCSLIDGSTIILFSCQSRHCLADRRVFLQKGFVNVMGNRGAIGAAGAVTGKGLHHDDDHILGIRVGREGGEPIIMADEFALFILHLGRAGLAANMQARNRRRFAGAFGLVLRLTQHRIVDNMQVALAHVQFI